MKQDLDAGHFSCVTLQTTDPDHSNAQQPLISTAVASGFSARRQSCFAYFSLSSALHPLSEAGLSGNLPQRNQPIETGSSTRLAADRDLA
jgi:hypothetical protein